MKQIIIGDIHGKRVWERIVFDHLDADRFIFIGDYLDAYDVTGIEQLNNLEAIVSLKKRLGDRVILLIGNHDHHYWPGVGYSGTSGYQSGIAASFEFCFNENRNLFQMCFKDEYDNVYSHAGLTKTFMELIEANTVDDVNDTFRYQPRKFLFSSMDRSNVGDHISQSCIWVRPQSLWRDKIANFQIVGHTQVGQIAHPPKSERQGFYVVDCLPKQYLSYTDGVFKIEKL